MNDVFKSIIGIILNPIILVSCNSTPEKEVLPNIVIIFADDFGYGDLSCYGATKIITPEVDKLASEGIRFTDAYVVSSVCSPSRYSLLTGRYSWRTHLKSGVLKSFAPPLIENGQTTLASMLKRNGYYTACIGKWHLGLDWALTANAPQDATESVFEAQGIDAQEYIDFTKPVRNGPTERGFDYFFGISGANNMIPHVLIENDKITMIPSIQNNFGARVLRAPNWDLRTLDQEFTKKAIELLDQHFSENNPKPLFLYFPTSAIHRPCLPDITKGKSQAGMRGDMVLEFDLMVGQIVKILEKHNSLKNTLLIVTSDNGPQPGDPYALVEKFKNKTFGEDFDFYMPYFSNFQPEYPRNGGQKTGWLVYDHDPTAGLLGFKSDAWEGGLRIPFIVHWPDKIKKGSVNSRIISTVDIFATITEIIGEKLHPDEGEDSYSFLNNLTDADAPQARKSLTLVSGRSGAMLVRSGPWKYIEGATPQKWDETQPYPPNNYPDRPGFLEDQLYNLSDDKFEKNNLVHMMPEKASELKGIIEKVKQTTKSEIE